MSLKVIGSGMGRTGTHSLKLALEKLLGAASGWAPLLLYFKGLSLTRASTAGYFEMLQTLAAVLITWGAFHEALSPLQVVAALVLIGAVAMVQRAQEATALPPPPSAEPPPPIPEARVV